MTGFRLPQGASRADYAAKVAELRAQGQPGAVHPPEESVSREEMQAAGKAPRILLTNVKQLELLLTRQQDIQMFEGARLDFLVADEAHTFSGANGAETACLLRRLRSFCGKSADETVCIATSATIADRNNPAPAIHFASRFFGVSKDKVEVVNEDYEPDLWATKRKVSPALPGNQVLQLRNVLEAIGNVDSDPPASLRLLKATFQSLTGQALDISRSRWQDSLFERLAENEVAYQIADALMRPRSMGDLVKDLGKAVGTAGPGRRSTHLAGARRCGAARRQGAAPACRARVCARRSGRRGDVSAEGHQCPPGVVGRRGWAGRAGIVPLAAHDVHDLRAALLCPPCSRLRVYRPGSRWWRGCGEPGYLASARRTIGRG